MLQKVLGSKFSKRKNLEQAFFWSPDGLETKIFLGLALEHALIHNKGQKLPFNPGTSKTLPAAKSNT